MLGIVISRADEASVHIGERLRAVADWTVHEDAGRSAADGGGTYYRTRSAELRTFDGLHIHLEGAAEAYDAIDCLAFASRHSGETGPLLTAHHTGNFEPADVGGDPDQLAVAAPGALSAALAASETHAPDGYDVGLECTHHGPTDLPVPSLFVEVGSAAPQWRDRAAATAAARTILSLRESDPVGDRTFVGFGGGHYTPRFTRIVRETDWAVGHIAADWALQAMGTPDAAVLDRAFDRSGASIAVVDGDHPTLRSAIGDRGYRVVGETWLRVTTGVAAGLIDRAERALCPVDEGLRFGRPARTATEPVPLEIVKPSADLLADANGVAAERVRGAIDAEAVAYETAESGNRVVGRIAIAGDDAWRRIETDLVDVLRRRFDEVAVTAEEIVVRERAFDPDRARDLGVEPGPAFGRLTDGTSVTVDDRVVTPDAVHVTRTRRYPRWRKAAVRRGSDERGNSNEDRSETG